MRTWRRRSTPDDDWRRDLVVAESEPGPAPQAQAEPVSRHRVPPQRTATSSPRDLGDLVTQAAMAFQDYRLGVPGGIDRLVRLVSPLLWHTARQCGLSTAEAEDSVQQTFLALVRRGELDLRSAGRGALVDSDPAPAGAGATVRRSLSDPATSRPMTTCRARSLLNRPPCSQMNNAGCGRTFQRSRNGVRGCWR